MPTDEIEDTRNDDFAVYGAWPVNVTSYGCGGEFCAGIGADIYPCAACREGVARTSIELRPPT